MGSDARRVVISSYIGSVLEWYDFLLYGTSAALVFNVVFFPRLEPLVGTIASFGTLAAGYVARPLGGIVFGHFGDRAGRKRMLSLSILVMGVSSVCIGLLPTYQQIGVAAPVILVVLRLAQGFAVGGEWGGAVLMAVEHARSHRRGLWGSFAQMGAPSGLLLSTLALTLASARSEEQFLSWGWRVPFLLSAMLVVVGLYIRLGVDESPVFADSTDIAGARRPPIIEIVRRHPKTLLLAIGVGLGPFAANSLLIAFMPAYAVGIGYPRFTTLVALMVASAMSLLTLPAYATLSDRVGRKPVYVAGAILLAANGFLLFPLVNSRSTLMFVTAYVLAMAVFHAAMYGPLAALLAELFTTRVRYTGASMGYQMASVLGGLAPLAASTLLAAGGGRRTMWVSAFIALICLVSAACAMLAPETREIDLSTQAASVSGGTPSSAL